MSNIPEDIKQKIKNRYGFLLDWSLITGAEYGYSLALPKIEELESIAGEQKKTIEIMNKLINSQIATQKEQSKEIERLKETIGEMLFGTP